MRIYTYHYHNNLKVAIVFDTICCPVLTQKNLRSENNSANSLLQQS